MQSRVALEFVLEGLERPGIFQTSLVGEYSRELGQGTESVVALGSVQKALEYRDSLIVFSCIM